MPLTRLPSQCAGGRMWAGLPQIREGPRGAGQPRPCLGTLSFLLPGHTLRPEVAL